MLGYEDKRDYLRMMVNTPVELAVDDAESLRTLTGLCKDLSASGMSIEVEESIEPGAQVRVSMDSPNSQLPSLNAKTKVVRCQSEDDGQFIVGLEILEMI
ncbi:hypothetical protein HMF8227_01370 [Saliniradius amylolyticus]|uniref:PilZ domain-containing protein n=1 Tax=Saliniradius amylolyticus TaxID=2183582 RepID=A0A2S2E2H7_9ALTE|nr:PilZ domain-containing protein [Saliniradius amylolyticus]AWL11848.1 hypothetical protein HMF8227_01370 [Saliniradius amylolyticus]